MFIHPRPSESELRDLYVHYGADYVTSDEMVPFFFDPTRSEREIRFLRRFARGGSLLDIGCATGYFVKAARDAGFDAEGVDIAVPSVNFGRKLGLPLTACDLLTEPPHRKYDVATMWATLEHLPDPVRHVRQAIELLVPGGLLFISVPNYSSITQKLIGRRDRYVGADHLNYFRPPVLRGFCESQGLHFLGLTTYGFNPILMMRDIRQHGEVTMQEIKQDGAATLKMKRSGLLFVQRCVEKALDIFSLGDVVAVCASRA